MWIDKSQAEIIAIAIKQYQKQLRKIDLPNYSKNDVEFVIRECDDIIRKCKEADD